MGLVVLDGRRLEKVSLLANVSLSRLVVALRQHRSETGDVIGWQLQLGHQSVGDVTYLSTVWRSTLEGLLKSVVHRLKAVQLLGVDLEHFALDKLVAVRPLVRVHSEHQLNDCPNVVRVVVWYPWEHALAHAFVQVVHVASAEGWLERKHFVDHAAQGPHVRLVTVRFVLPDLRRGVVRSARLRVIEPVLIGHFAYVHVAQLGLVKVATLGLSLLGVAEQEDVG